ncbi:MAG: hypothetical protein PHF29_07050 [Candidatus Riflebacteria bacterium]|nr:hypothetical protein [Candidatus Riflebacteria bacterium]
MIKITSNKSTNKNVLINESRKGFAIFMVLGFIAIMVPVVYMFSQIGSSKTKQAMKFHEHLKTELTAISGNTAILSRMRGNVREFAPMPDETSGEDKFSASVFKTGDGFLGQDLHIVLTKSKVNNHAFTLLCDVEQFQPEPSPPVTIISHDYWGTIEPYEISLLADALAMQNFRGVELLRLEQSRDFERAYTEAEYKNIMSDKKSSLPEELSSSWSTVVNALVSEKLPKEES